MEPGAPGGPGQSVPPQAPAPAGRADVASDEVLYHGIGKHSAIVGRYVLWIGVCIGGAVGGVALMKVAPLSSYPMWLLGVLGLPSLIWTYLRNVTSRYKVTRHRIEFERGILGRNVDSLELWRVLDVRYEQSLVDRMLQNGKIVLMGTDQTHPELVLYGLPGSRWVFERLREAVQQARHRGRPMELVGSDGVDGASEFVG